MAGCGLPIETAFAPSSFDRSKRTTCALIIVTIASHAKVIEPEQEIQLWPHVTGENNGAAHYSEHQGISTAAQLDFRYTAPAAISR